jgi:ERCC4-type nuclease
MNIENNLMSCRIVVDKREREIITLARASTASSYFEEEHLTTGDYIVLTHTDAALVIIERKTWADLAASIKDGRIENIEKLKEYSKQTGARIAYLIEGPHPRRGASVSNIPYKCLRSHLDHLMLRENMLEIQTANRKDTVTRLAELAQNLSTLKSDNPSCDSLALAKRKIEIPDKQTAVNMWTAIPQIGFKTARVLVENTSFKSALENPADLKPAGSRASLITKALNCKEVQKKILAKIPGISLVMAEIILESVLFSDLDTASLENIKIRDRSLGAIRAARIKHFFTFKDQPLE